MKRFTLVLDHRRLWHEKSSFESPYVDQLPSSQNMGRHGMLINGGDGPLWRGTCLRQSGINKSYTTCRALKKLQIEMFVIFRLPKQSHSHWYQFLEFEIYVMKSFDYSRITFVTISQRRSATVSLEYIETPLYDNEPQKLWIAHFHDSTTATTLLSHKMTNRLSKTGQYYSKWPYSILQLFPRASWVGKSAG